MRLALVHMRHARSGGTERYLNQVARHLAERGHEVTIVCRSHEEPPHPDVRFEVLRDLAVGGAWRMWAFARAVERRLARSEHDLVYGLGKTWTHDVVRLSGGLHASYLERSHLATLTGWERVVRTDRLKHRLALAIERRALAPESYVHVVANSRMVAADAMARHGVPAERITTVWNGVDLARFRPELRATAGARLRAELGLGAEERVVLFLGTGYGRKGLDVLLEAFPAVLAARPEARLLVAGRDAAIGAWRARAERLGLGGRVRFLGGRADAEAVYAASELYCLPTRYDSFGLTILEALASGLPVVTTDAAGGAEVLEEGVGAVLPGGAPHAPPSAAGLAAELVAWLDPERLAAARPLARAVAEGHPEERTARESAAVLERVAASGERVLGRAAVPSG